MTITFYFVDVVWGSRGGGGGESVSRYQVLRILRGSMVLSVVVGSTCASVLSSVLDRLFVV